MRRKKIFEWKWARDCAIAAAVFVGLGTSVACAGNNRKEAVEKGQEKEIVEDSEKEETLKKDTSFSDEVPVSLPYENVTGKAVEAAYDTTGDKLGFITGFTESGGQSFLCDYAEWIPDQKEPNGFRIKNPEKEEVVCQVNEATEYVIVLPDAHAYVVDKDNFMEYLKEKEQYSENWDFWGEEDKSVGPFWIQEEEGVVRRIHEKYVP